MSVNAGRLFRLGKIVHKVGALVNDCESLSDLIRVRSLEFGIEDEPEQNISLFAADLSNLLQRLEYVIPEGRAVKTDEEEQSAVGEELSGELKHAKELVSTSLQALYNQLKQPREEAAGMFGQLSRDFGLVADRLQEAAQLGKDFVASQTPRWAPEHQVD